MDGRKYTGEWKDNCMHGKGVYTWKDGRKYEGEYEMDKKHGHGKYQWADGRVYDGPWVDGKQHGQGKYMLNDGTEKIGVWVNGKRVKWIEETDCAKTCFLNFTHCYNSSSYPTLPLLHSLSLIHICRCRRIERCRSRWSPYH
eukprot:TRINITY_DN4657_c0_g6_i2.p2 TRINITY_DN4657_c0_g6~~TRINITY_DN4657_c0_g6_i2.p2  ORF type:complete len:142 (+),score=38.10 TRINITY_DN4657_c0_g6_i2:856-1281(+)